MRVAHGFASHDIGCENNRELFLDVGADRSRAAADADVVGSEPGIA
jgi:hypothetical protein